MHSSYYPYLINICNTSRQRQRQRHSSCQSQSQRHLLIIQLRLIYIPEKISSIFYTQYSMLEPLKTIKSLYDRKKYYIIENKNNDKITKNRE